MPLTRRRLLTGAAAAGAVLVARPTGVLAQALGPADDPGAARASRLSPGRWLVHADLHNHTLFSDGDGDPAEAFASMRANGLDVAALTDHAVLGGPIGAAMTVCGDGCNSIRGIDDASWAGSAVLADGADAPGVFTAIRGFEWSSPTLGHMNVWFGEDWIDPERTAGLVGVESLPGLLHEVPEVGPQVGDTLESLLGTVPTGAVSMGLFYDWLTAQPGGALLGGGADALVGFNHPGREPGRFGRFHFDARLTDRLVSLELFNRSEDYLFEGTDAGRPSPLVECLDAGWRPGILGVTDEHGDDWGSPLGKGRAGLWVTELSRAGVREALQARRFFATRERGLRFDATAGGVPMGGTIAHERGPIEVVVDIDGGPAWVGRALVVQLLRTGGQLPTVAAEVDVVVPAPGEPLVRFTVPVDVADGAWLVLRVVDPTAAPDGRAIGALGRGRSIAYASPFHLDPSAARAGGGPAAPLPSGEPAPTAPVVGPGEEAPVPGPGSGSTSSAGDRRLPATGGGTRTGLVGLTLGAAVAAAAMRRRALAGDAAHSHHHGDHDGHHHGHGDHDHSYHHHD